MDIRTRLLSFVLAALWIAACSPPHVQESPLVIEEYPLVAPPQTESGGFLPSEGSMEQILVAHAAQRSRLLPPQTIYMDGRPAMQAALGSQTLIAVYQHGDPMDSVIVQKNGLEIYRVEIGMPSPIDGLRGLWTYDGHWVLETAYVTQESVRGQLTRDGLPLQYDEAFEFQVLDGQSFFFFSQAGRIGISFANEHLDAYYDEVPHYRCCSASALNPIHAENMVAFFARRGATWYYVEAGLFAQGPR